MTLALWRPPDPTARRPGSQCAGGPTAPPGFLPVLLESFASRRTSTSSPPSAVFALRLSFTMGPFLARLRASLSASSSNSASPATTMADALPAPADRPPPPPSSASLKRRGSLGAGLALLRARPGAAEPQPESQASRTVALAVVDDRPPRVDLLLPDKEAAGPPTVSPARSAEAVRKEEDAVLANLRLKPDEVAGLVRRLCGKLSERGQSARVPVGSRTCPSCVGG